MQANKFSVYPTVGQKIMVRHRSELDKHGNSVLKKAPTVERTVSQVFLSDDGTTRVKDSAGDVWHVKPERQDTWETVSI